MISATELRIGNLVNIWEFENESFHLRPSPLTLGVFIDLCKDNLIKPLEGIPLTPDWLQKFGFGYNIENELYELRKFIEWESGVVEFTMTDYEADWVFAKKHDAYRSIEWVTLAKIDFVHQLQNLYHALTGQELELKEKP